VSEKRQRKQQRRQRRKASGARRNASPDRVLAEVARLAAGSVTEVPDAFTAEQWASNLLSTWQREAPPGEPIDAGLFQAFARALQRVGTPGALTALRSLNAIGTPTVAGIAQDAAQPLVGLEQPAWIDELGQARPVGAALLDEPAFDDGFSVMLEFAEPAGEHHTLSVYIDHNLGGIVKDVLLADTIDQVRARMDTSPERDRVVFRDLDLGEARARVEAALDALDHTYEPPVDEDVFSLRALIEARLRLLPAGVEWRLPYEELPQAERDRLLADFLESDDGRRWRDDEVAEYVAQLAIDFGADYNHGGPLRWSAVVVEIFMLDWLARKVSEEAEFFARVPDVLADWVRYAGRRRGVPDELVREAAAAVEAYRGEMLEAVTDPASWGPAKLFATAATEAGVDLSDPAAVERFVEEYNRRYAG
jgi:hypothetical protein